MYIHFAGLREKLGDIVGITTARDWNKSFTHIAVVSERLTVKVWCSFSPILNHSLLCASVSVESTPHSYLLTSAAVRIPSPKCGTEPIRYVKFHFRDQRRLASSRYRNRAEITVLLCERKPYLGMVLLPARELSGTVGHSPTEARTPLPVCSLPQGRCL